MLGPCAIIATVVVSPIVWIRPGVMAVFSFSCLIYISRSVHTEEERSVTHNGPSDDGEYKSGGWAEIGAILRSYTLSNR